MKNYIVLLLLCSSTSLFGMGNESDDQSPHQPTGSRPSNATHGRRILRPARSSASTSFAQGTTAADVAEEVLRLEREATYGMRPSSPISSHSHGSSPRQSCSVSPQVSPHVHPTHFSPHAPTLRGMASQPLSVITEGNEEYSDEEEKKN